MTVLGIDAGTTSLSLARTDGAGRFLDARTCPGEPPDAQRCQDPDAALRLVLRAMEELPAPDAVAVTGQMHGILYVDAAGRAVSPLYTWQSPLGEAERTPGESYARYAARATGYAAASGYGLVTHLCLSERGELPKNAAKLCTVGDYIAMRLSGRKTPLLHASNAASLGFFDLRTRRFDENALKTLGIPPELLPEVTDTVRETAQGVFTAVGDNQASFCGAAGGEEGTLLANVGTGGQLSCLVRGYEECPHCETRPYNGDAYLLVAASLCGGRAYAVLERFFAETLRAYGVELSEEEVYAGMTRMLEGARALEVDTAFAGTRAEPERRGAVRGISDTNFTPGALAAGVLEGIAAEFLPAYRTMCARHGFGRLALSGNAARRNPRLRAAFGRLYGLPLAPSAPPEEAAVGAARMAAQTIMGTK